MEQVSKSQLNVLRSGIADALEATLTSLTALLRMSKRSPVQAQRIIELKTKREEYSSMLAQLDTAAAVYDRLSAA